MAPMRRALWPLLLALPLFAQEAPAPEALLARAAALEREEDALRAAGRELAAAQRRAFELADELEGLRARRAEVERDPALQQRMQALVGELQRATVALEGLQAAEPRQAREAKAGALARQLAALLGDLDRALERDPAAWALRLRRGELLAGKEQWGPARADAEKVAFERPDEPRALLLLGRCLVPENRFREAEGLFARARALADSDEARACHALALHCLNRFAEARAAAAALQAPGALPGWLRGAWWLEPAPLEAAARAWEAELALQQAEATKDDLPRVELETTRGKLVVELFEDQAPSAVASFLELVEAGFHDGLAWHRVVPNALVQSGDPRTREGAPPDAAPGPGWRVKDEDPSRPARGLFRGALALSRSERPDSAGSQFLIAVVPRLAREAPPTVFGRVREGMQVVDALRPGDRLVRARVLRKRPHAYEAPKVPGDR